MVKFYDLYFIDVMISVLKCMTFDSLLWLVGDRVTLGQCLLQDVYYYRNIKNSEYINPRGALVKKITFRQIYRQIYHIYFPSKNCLAILLKVVC